MIAALVAALAVAGDPAPILAGIEGFDLANVTVREASCADRGQSDDVVVCAPKNMQIWVADSSGFEAIPLRASFTGPLNTETVVHVIQHETPVATVPAAAVTLKWHF
ncbi:hypothetical protein ACFOKI_02365 [Sphingomonas qilianensis]|uniref:Secreted protein n=1 Tax=Sphingomonas qilianensis TaxID=1736690 RepID=A0ABU9XRX2_9SPHN